MAIALAGINDQGGKQSDEGKPWLPSRLKAVSVGGCNESPPDVNSDSFASSESTNSLDTDFDYTFFRIETAEAEAVLTLLTLDCCLTQCLPAQTANTRLPTYH